MLRRIAISLLLACAAVSAQAQRVAQIAPSTNQGFIPESFWAVPSFYANAAGTGAAPSWLVHTWGATPTQPPTYFDASGNLRFAPNNLVKNSSLVGGVAGSPGTQPNNMPSIGIPAGLTVTTSYGTYQGVYGEFVSYSGTPTGSGSANISMSNITDIPAVLGQHFVGSVYVAVSSGSLTNLTIRQFEYNSSQSWVNTSFSVGGTSSTLTRISSLGTISNAATVSTSLQFQFDYTISVPISGTIFFAQPQLEASTTAQTTPNPFMPTSGSAYYSPVVNDHNPSTLAALGLRSEPQRTNLFLNNTAPATQTVTVANATQYTVSFYGTGTEVLTGACTTTMTGAAGVRTSYTCTSATTSLVMTDTGLTATAYPQVEANAFATSPILTYGAAVTVPADNWSFTGAEKQQLVSGSACLVLEAQAEGIGQNPFLFAVSNGGVFTYRFDAYMGSATTAATDVTVNGTQYSPAGASGGSIISAKRRYAINMSPGLASVSYDGSATVTAAHPPVTSLTAAVLGGAYTAPGGWNGWFSQILLKPSCTAAQVQAYSTANSNMSH